MSHSESLANLSLIVSSIGPITPKSKISQALRDFEDSLSQDDKHIYDLDHGVMLSTPYQISNFLGVIEHKLERSKKRYANRMMKFLEGLSGITGVIDVIVGGSQCEIACGVWGVVRLTLQAASITSYLANISDLFVAVGKHYPTNTDLGAIFHDSKALQSAICEYAILLIGLCKAVVYFLRKNPALQLATVAVRPFATSKFLDYRTKLEAQMQEIRDKAFMASVTLQREVSIDVGLLRTIASKVSDSQAQELEMKNQIRANRARALFLESVSVYDYQYDLRQAIGQGRASWAFAHNAYKSWVSVGGMLWCCGIVGSGKSVLSASIIHSIMASGPDVTTAYFFCRYDRSESLRAETAIRCLAKQILQTKKMDFENVALNLDFSVTDQILDFLGVFLKDFDSHYILVDGLDDYADQETRSLLSFLARLVKMNKALKVFCSSRPEIKLWAINYLSIDHVIHMSECGEALSDYINDALLERLEDNRLSLGDERLIVDISDTLIAKAQGMFLWVKFQVDSICAQKSDEGILQTLQDLPRNLPETYERILKKVDSSEYRDPTFCTNTLKIIATAIRPLNLEELREATSVEPGTVIWKPERMVNDMNLSLRSCGSLLFLDEDEATVHFAHSSVKQYLQQTSLSPSLREYQIDIGVAELFIADVIVTYLSYEGKYDTQLTRIEQSEVEIPADLAKHIIDEVLPPGNFNSIARKYLKARGKARCDARHALRAQKSSSANSSLRTNHPFLPYAQEHWMSHTTAYIQTLASGMPGAMAPLIMGKIDVVKVPWNPEVASDLGPKYLDCIVRHLHWPLILQTLELLAEKDFFRETLDYLRTRLPTYNNAPLPVQRFYEGLLTDQLTKIPFTKANGAIVHWLIQTGTSTEARPEKDSALLAAVSFGRIEELDALLSVEKEINQRHEKFGSAIIAACENGDFEIAKALLAAGADPNLTCESHGSAMQVAALRGHIGIIELLARNGAEVNARGGPYGSPLRAAMCFGNTGVVERLKSLGAHDR